MKRFLTTSFIALTLLVGAAGAAPVAHAAGCTVDADCGGGGQTCNLALNGGTCQAAAAGDGGAAATPNNNLPGSDTGSVFGTVITWIMGLFAWLAGVAMIALNYAMYYTVVDMGTYVKGLNAIGLTWQVLRDLGNIVLIFGFLALGITTILNVNWYGDRKKLVVMLLVVAVFLNFSLFISEAVIDIGNLFATQIYTQINNNTVPAQANLNTHSISDTILAQLGLATIYGEVTNPATGQKVLINGSTWYVGFMGILLFIVLAFVLFALAFILISRFVILLFLIIVAPLGFAGLVVPKLQNTARGWWSMLFKQTIIAPVLLLLLYIALRVITDVNFLTGFGSTQANQNADWLGTMTNNVGGFGSVLLSFLVGMGLLLAVVMLAQRMSAFGASWASKTAGALSFGMTAYALRSTAGASSQYLSRKVRDSRFGATKAGRITATTLDRGGKANFDLRGTTALKNFPVGGINAGAPQKGGYAKTREDNIKSQETYAKSLGGRQQTQKEEAATEAAKAKLAQAKTAYDAAAVEAKKQEDEFNKNGINATNREQLDTARATLQSSKSALDIATTEAAAIAKTNTPLTKSELSKAYGENLQSTPITSWVMFGSGTSEAAKNIKSLKKSDEERLVELIKENARKNLEAEQQAKKAAETAASDGAGSSQRQSV